MKREATLGNLLSQTFVEMGEHTKAIVIYIAILIPVGALSNYFDGSDQVGFGIAVESELLAQGAIPVLVVLLALVVNIVLTYWLYASLMRGTTGPGFDRFWPWLGVYILASLGIILGMIFLIVPGLILLTRWAVALPLATRGDIGAMDTFGASWNATRGRGWSIFGAALILFLGIAVVIGASVGIATVFLTGSPVADAVMAGLSEAIATAVFVAFSVGAYRLLWDGAEEAAEVFA